MEYEKPCYTNCLSGKYHFVLVIQIRKTERGKEYLVLVNSYKRIRKEERRSFPKPKMRDSKEEDAT